MIRQRWNTVGIQAIPPETMQLNVGDSLTVGARVWLNGLQSSDVAVEVVSGLFHETHQMIAPQVVALAAGQPDQGALVYTGAIQPVASGQFAVGIRVRPSHPGLIDPNEMGLATWAAG